MMGDAFWSRIFGDLGCIFIPDSYYDECTGVSFIYFYLLRSDNDDEIFDCMDDLGVTFKSESELFSWLRVNYEKVLNKILEKYENK